MCIATLLAILARCIDQHIFQLTYILHEEDVIRHLLVRPAVANSKWNHSAALSYSPYSLNSKQETPQKG
jgi:hypothetical protein